MRKQVYKVLLYSSFPLRLLQNLGLVIFTEKKVYRILSKVKIENKFASFDRLFSKVMTVLIIIEDHTVNSFGQFH